MTTPAPPTPSPLGWPDADPATVAWLDQCMRLGASAFVEAIIESGMLEWHGRDAAFTVDALEPPVIDGKDELVVPRLMWWNEAGLGLADIVMNAKPVASIVRAEVGDKYSVNAVLAVETHRGIRSAALLCSVRNADQLMPEGTLSAHTEGFLVGVSELDSLPFVHGTVALRAEHGPVDLADNLEDTTANRIKRAVPGDAVASVALATAVHHLLQGARPGEVVRFGLPTPARADYRPCERCEQLDLGYVTDRAPFDLPHYENEHAQSHVAVSVVEACVDGGIASMIEALWRAGLFTHAGCQGEPSTVSQVGFEGYVSFRTVDIDTVIQQLGWITVEDEAGDRWVTLEGDVIVGVDESAIRWQGTDVGVVAAAVIAALS